MTTLDQAIAHGVRGTPREFPEVPDLPGLGAPDPIPVKNPNHKSAARIELSHLEDQAPATSGSFLSTRKLNDRATNLAHEIATLIYGFKLTLRFLL